MIESFLISYAAANVPTLLGLIDKTPDVKKHLDRCFSKAIDRWDALPEVKAKAKNDCQSYYKDFSDLLRHTPKGRHPLVNSLLLLWKEEVERDSVCRQFLSDVKIEGILEISLDVQQRLSEIARHSDELDKLSKNITALLNPFRNVGVKSCRAFWDEWAVGSDFVFNTGIVLEGRDNERKKLLDRCNEAGVTLVVAQSVSEAMAFAAAAILLDDGLNGKRTVVITDAASYERIIAEASEQLIIISDVPSANHHNSASKGHTVFYCTNTKNPVEKTGAIEIQPMYPSCFINALKNSFDSKTDSYALGRQCGYDAMNLRRIMGIDRRAPIWLTDSNRDAIVALALIDGWDENNDCDREIVEMISGMEYDSFVNCLTPLLSADNSPVIRIESCWKVKSKVDLILNVLSFIADRHIDRLAKVIEFLSIDIDPQVKEEMEEKKVKLRRDEHLFSSFIKQGVYESLAILSVFTEKSNPAFADGVKGIVRKVFEGFDIEKYLNNKPYVKFLADADPEAFLDFLRKDIKNGDVILSELFRGREKEFGFTRFQIYFTEILSCLECIAFDGEMLGEVTDILMHLLRYPKVDNYADCAWESLVHIYQFGAPQTSAPASRRIELLENFAGKYPEEMFNLSVKILSLVADQHGFCINPGFRYRKKEIEYEENVMVGDLRRVCSLMLKQYVSTPENFNRLLDIAMTPCFYFLRTDIVIRLDEEAVRYSGDSEIADYISDALRRHREYPDARWALHEVDLTPFDNLYETVVNDNLKLRYREYFTEIDPVRSKKFEIEDMQRDMEESRKLRASKLQEIIERYGIEGMLDFANEVMNQSAIADAVSCYDPNEYAPIIYQAYIDNRLEENTVVRYFRILFEALGEDKYMDLYGWIKNEQPEDVKADRERDLNVMLYAPCLQARLLDEVKKSEGEALQRYWERVTIWGTPEGVSALEVAESLRKAGRYGELLGFLKANNSDVLITDEFRTRILVETTLKDPGVLNGSLHQFKKILLGIDIKNLTKDEDIGNLYMMELLLYPRLEHYLQDKERLHVYTALDHDCSLMLDCLGYMMGEIEKGVEIWGQVLYSFLSEYPGIICMNINNTVNYSALEVYLKNLLSCREEKKIPFILVFIGKMLCRVFIHEGKVTQEFCHILESLNSDNVDDSLRCEIFNSRGVVTRDTFADGDEERSLMMRYDKLAKESAPYSSRLCKIFRELSRDYKAQAAQEDLRAMQTRYR